MIAVLQMTDGNIVEILFEDDVAQWELDETITKLKAAIDKHGEIRVLKEIRSVGLPLKPPSKLWADIEDLIQSFDRITHAAIVTDQLWIEKLTEFVNPVLKTEARCFDPSEIDNAREWLQTAV